MNRMVMEVLLTMATISHHLIYLINNRRHRLSCRIIDHFTNVTMAIWVIKNHRIETLSICHHQDEDNVFVRIIIEISRILCDRLICRIRIISPCIVWIILALHRLRRHILILIEMIILGDRGRICFLVGIISTESYVTIKGIEVRL